jgi:hypothetical protein
MRGQFVGPDFINGGAAKLFKQKDHWQPLASLHPSSPLAKII